MDHATQSLAYLKSIHPAIHNPKVSEFAEYWMSIHPEGRLPSRADFDPIDIPSLLPNLVLVDVTPDPIRFMVRLQGTDVTRVMKRELKGTYLDEAFPNFEQSFPYLDRVHVVETGLPVHRFGSPSLQFALDYAPVERLHLPLSSDGTAVDKVISIFFYEQKPDLRGSIF
ncbi:PAS domain-containing protein [Nisaea nitritireducens]|uniref:PAS domain-containing protein n=1 Tax=Nisaea nitritireducens TaxID=568392 RepID=UPI00186668CE|nr:PAS domain-containing protein [Nisaea nitritireducens]